MVISTMSQIGEATVELHRTKMFFGRNPDDLEWEPFMEWSDRMQAKNPTRLRAPPTGHVLSPGQQGVTTAHSGKIPSFDVPVFNGSMIDGHSYLQAMQDTFRSSAMEQYLKSEAHCDHHTSWSGAFASRIRESIKDNPNLSFLAAELDKEDNCAKVWDKIRTHLSSEDVITARIMNLWTQMFSLKCDDKDTFVAFYSQVKGISHKLAEHNSIAVLDDTFMQAFLPENHCS